MSPRFKRISFSTNNKFLDRLEHVLETRLPDSVHILVLLQLKRAQRLPKEVSTEMYIYCCDEDVGNSGLEVENENPFIVCIQTPNLYSKKGILILPPRNPNSNHIEAFDKLMTWNEPQLFISIQPSFWSVVQTLSDSHGKWSEMISCVFYAITDINKAKNLEVEEFSKNNLNLIVRPLTKSDAFVVVHKKEWEQPHSEEVVKMCVDTLPSVGVFENDEIASCVFVSSLGACNALYTSERFRNRGLAQFVMKWITREFSKQLKVMPLVERESWNPASKKLVTGAGYEEMFDTKWFKYQPK